MPHSLEIITATFLALIPISNPFSTVPLFLSLTRGQPEDWKRQQALRASFFMAGILLTFLWSGAIIIEFFGISIPAIRIAGGTIIMRVGFGMLSPGDANAISDEAKEESKQKSEIAFTPLAMPSLSGPGSIAVVIGMAAGSDDLPGYLSISAGIILVAITAWLSLRSGRYVARFLGVTGLDALTRIMGFILICIAFQFVFDGLSEYASGERFLGPLIQSLEAMVESR